MIFVSYSWIEENPDIKVLALVDKLRQEGYHVTCDVMFIQQGTSTSFPELMALNMSEAEKIIVVLSKEYKAKADSFNGGVGQEYRYIIADIVKERSKYILVSFDSDYESITPSFLIGREIIILDCCDKYYTLYYRLSNTNEYEFSEVNPHTTIPKPKRISVENLPKKDSIKIENILSSDDNILLKVASKDQNGLIKIIPFLVGEQVTTCGMFFNKQGDSRGLAKWESSIESLKMRGYISLHKDRQYSQNNIICYKVTYEGYQASDQIADSIINEEDFKENSPSVKQITDL